MIKIKSYGPMLLLSVVLLAACSKQQIKPKSSDLNSEDVPSSRAVPAGYIEVKNVQDLLNVKNNLAGKYFQTADINLIEIANFEPIGDRLNPFTGVYNGNKFFIQNLKIDQPKKN